MISPLSTPVPCVRDAGLECPNQQALIPWELWALLALATALAVICLIGWVLAARRARRAEQFVGGRRKIAQPAPPTVVPTTHPIPATQVSQPEQQPARQVIEELIALDDMTVSPAMSSQINRILRTAGAEKDSPEPGSPFDPNLHSAVSTIPGNGDGDGPYTIADVIRPGWRIGSTMIRPAEVSVQVGTAIPHE
ncbi:nucleotide exchange factor GrpE [Arthrobacter sp. W4I7]|uniref:nucleotide exchange factor GrpE n=1 Tax=Arthrobacter sp. W4I7 TaxID=3042296 RepID=UPI002782F5EF|nr:hypothetical protein [Arthrobacter sp. W4I7]